MSKYKIEKNIPVPCASNKGGLLKYPWPEMEVGDHIFVPGKKTGDIMAASRGWSKRNAPGWKFTARAVDGGVRIWRIK